MSNNTSWESYEKVAEYLLGKLAPQFGLSNVEGKQKIEGASRTEWEVEAKGVRGGPDEAFIIIECRKRARKINQEQIGGLAFRIQDTGAGGGIIVSPLGLQAGAQKVANSKNIVSVVLKSESTEASYVLVLEFLNRIFAGDTIRVGDRIHVIARDENGNVTDEYQSDDTS